MTAAKKARAPRTAKTPRQRAEERVGVLERQHGRLMKKRIASVAETTRLNREIAETEARLKHEREHPDLQNPSTTDTTTED